LTNRNYNIIIIGRKVPISTTKIRGAYEERKIPGGGSARQKTSDCPATGGGAVAGGGYCADSRPPAKRQAKLPNGEEIQQTGPVEKKPDSIAIPGYEGINLKADTKEQEIGFPNPAQNTCYFQISLILEDGTTLWQSELVKPGEISEPITLNEPLAAGVYPNSLLKFDCYTMDGSMRSLNGAATKMTIHVS